MGALESLGMYVPCGEVGMASSHESSINGFRERVGSYTGSYPNHFTVFNEIWVTKESLTSGKLSKILPVLKPNKDTSLNTSYRAIALLSVIGKLFGRLVHARLYWWLEKNFYYQIAYTDQEKVDAPLMFCCN